MVFTSGDNEWTARVARLRYQVLSGVQYAHVSPIQWQVDPASLREIAGERGYVEIAPMFQGCLSFQYAPHLLPQRPVFDHPETEPSKSRERWLLNRIEGEEEIWLSVRHAKLSTQHIAAIAARAGMTIACDCADATERQRSCFPFRSPLSSTSSRARPRSVGWPRSSTAAAWCSST